MSDFRPLGKPIRPDPEVIEDEFEEIKTKHGPMLRNKRTGALETVITQKGPQYAPSPAVDVILEHIRKQQEAIAESLNNQAADGFCLNEFGVM